MQRERGTNRYTYSRGPSGRGGALAAYDQMFYLLKAEGYSGLGTWMWDTLSTQRPPMEIWPVPAAPIRSWREPPAE